ncbi:hypothetical protein PIB30_018603 [Stylosanthes scabra]|uniref:Ribonuclease H1 N-terminal domain-containing protein n=1 Tax=Stylosanthes scabra TaxID=79078 RepID=A0ABU6S8B0_9FABA|nr:hypothetical protein [Stylosanthes scabra]
MEEGKYSHYVVHVGKVTGIYTSWAECAPNVLGYSRAQFKGFNSLDEAIAYMERGTNGKGKKVGSTSKGFEKLSPQMAMLGMGTSRMLPTQPESTEVYGSVPIWSSAETQGGDFLIVEDMEFYLLRDRKVFYDKDGLKPYAFTAVLRCDHLGINVEVDSNFSPDEARSRDDTAYKLLDHLLKHTGNSIYDFNYRQLCLAQQQLEEHECNQDSTLLRRLREAERHVKLLKDELGVYKKHLGF